MKNNNEITLCITMGKRPLLLEKTLKSIFNKGNFKHVIAINDFGDVKSNEVFKTLCPQGKLISLDKNLGHHKAIDFMYSQVQTEFVFHCEDDWFFDNDFEFEKYIQILNSYKNASMVCFRNISEFNLSKDSFTKIEHLKISNLEVVRLNRLHEQWHGYTFNPHIARLNLWKETGGFAPFKKERHISRWLRAKGKYVFYLEKGLCHHIGEYNSVSITQKDLLWKTLKIKIKDFIKVFKK